MLSISISTRTAVQFIAGMQVNAYNAALLLTLQDVEFPEGSTMEPLHNTSSSPSLLLAGHCVSSQDI